MRLEKWRELKGGGGGVIAGELYEDLFDCVYIKESSKGAKMGNTACTKLFTIQGPGNDYCLPVFLCLVNASVSGLFEESFHFFNVYIRGNGLNGIQCTPEKWYTVVSRTFLSRMKIRVRQSM